MTEIAEARYIPVLSVRPAEMNALLGLPERDKDLLLPAIQLRPWVGSYEFSNTLDKIRTVFGEERKWIANLDCDYIEPEEKRNPETGEVVIRPAVEEFRRLCDPSNGYENWCAFFEEEGNENLIPCIQLSDMNEFDEQLARLSSLERGLVVHMTGLGQMLNEDQLSALGDASEQNSILFIIDYGDIPYRQDLNLLISQWMNAFDAITEEIPNCFIAISGTSFPQQFEGLTNREIKERQLYGVAVATNQNHDWNLIYSDRGSARQQAQRGGGGAPYPRIDYPTSNAWYFYRSEQQDGEYRGVAQATVGSEHWNPDLRIWGTQMIERTAQGDERAIGSPAKATAVRINIHLHQQLFFDEPGGLLDTDDEWVD